MKVAAVALLALAACSHANGSQSAKAGAAPVAVEVEDAIHGARYELPPSDEVWQVSHNGDARTASGVEVEVGWFPLAKDANPAACRDRQRELATKDADAPRDESTADDPTAIWIYVAGGEPAELQKRIAFFARGADCLALRVSGAKGDKIADKTFSVAARSMKVLTLQPERQRELDLMAGSTFLERREPEAALDRFEALAEREPDVAKAQYGALLAGFAMGVKGYPRALRHGLLALKAERELIPEQRQLALRAVGVMQLAENQIRGAADTLAELVVRAPELAEGQYNYACALARLGDTPGALDHLRKAVQLDGELVTQARIDDDLKSLRGSADFERLLTPAKK
jgi:tetratricopeptide (TPR) repeat protein